MPRYKPTSREPMLLPVILAEQIQPGTFEFALDHLVDHELDLSALDARFHNDETGASAYDPRVMLKIVLLAYSRGLISSRGIERACRDSVLFMAMTGDSQPSYTHIARFVRELGQEIRPLFTQVLLTCARQGLIGRQMFAFDGVKLPSNASKECSGTHAELRHRANRLDQAARRMIELHQPLQDQWAYRTQIHRHQDRLRRLRNARSVPAPSRAHAGAAGLHVRQRSARRVRGQRADDASDRLSAQTSGSTADKTLFTDTSPDILSNRVRYK